MKRVFLQLPLYAWLGLICVIAFSWLVRIHRLDVPGEYVFDERYHVPAVQLIADDDPRAFEWWRQPEVGASRHDWLHPPLAKYIQAWFFTAFGQGPAAWRLASAVFGVVGIGLTFLVTQLAFRQPAVSLLAAFLLSLDGLWLVQSRVAMNDVFVAVWLLAALAAYLWYRQLARLRLLLLVGLLLGAALATKWSAGFIIIGLLIWELLALYRQRKLKVVPWAVFALLIVPVGVYLASWLPLLQQGKDFGYLIELHRQIIGYQLYANISHAYQSSPWQWLLNWRPVWYWTGGEGQNVYALNNPLLAWFELGAALLSVGWLFWRKKIKRHQSSLAFLLTMFVVSFVPWISSPRISFYYHFAPAVPLAAMLLAYWLHEIYFKSPRAFNRLLLFFTLAMLVWVFWLYYPHWTGLAVSSAFAEAIYFPFANWR